MPAVPLEKHDSSEPDAAIAREFLPKDDGPRPRARRAPQGIFFLLTLQPGRLGQGRLMVVSARCLGGPTTHLPPCKPGCT